MSDDLHYGDDDDVYAVELHDTVEVRVGRRGHADMAPLPRGPRELRGWLRHRPHDRAPAPPERARWIEIITEWNVSRQNGADGGEP
jgi:hypothetical protein